MIQSWWRDIREARQQAQPLVSTGTSPLIIGPWLGEVGPELQYWIPWLQHLKAQGVFGQRRLIAVSRGGTAAWYRQLTSEYGEVFTLVDKATYQAIRQERKTEKQFAWTPGERTCMQQIAQHFGVKQYETLHPSAMWARILPYFQERKPLAWFLSQLDFQPIIPAADLAQDYLRDISLPEQYIVARFYVSELFPATALTKQFVHDLFAQITPQLPIVAMVSTQQLDDHAIFKMPEMARVQLVPIDQQLESNLGVQTAIIQRSSGFVGTYGGVTVLPGLVGKPCLGFIGAETLGTQATLHFRHEAVTAKLYQTVARQPYLAQTVNAWYYQQHYNSVKPSI